MSDSPIQDQATDKVSTPYALQPGPRHIGNSSQTPDYLPSRESLSNDYANAALTSPQGDRNPSFPDRRTEGISYYANADYPVNSPPLYTRDNYSRPTAYNQNLQPQSHEGFNGSGPSQPPYQDAQYTMSQMPEPDLSFTRHPAPPQAQHQRLAFPVVFPQLATSFHGPGFSPFSRGYAPALAPAGVSLNEWLAFVDGLNLAFTANPPLQMLGLVGGFIGMV